jgi:hypothetical protein
MINFKSITLTALQKLLAPYTNPLIGTWYRAIQLKFTPTALQYSHTATESSRFGSGIAAKPAYPLLYLAENHQVSLLEVQAILGSPGSGVVVSNPRSAWAILNVAVNLHEVADLTDLSAQAGLKTSAQELTGDWVGYKLRGRSGATITAPVGNAPTQELGATLYRFPKLQGFLTISAKAPDRKNLVIFPDKIKTHAKSFIQFTDPATGKIHKIP